MLANHHTTCCWACLLYFYPVPHTLALTQSSSHIFASFLYLPLICLIFHSPSPSIKFFTQAKVLFHLCFFFSSFEFSFTFFFIFICSLIISLLFCILFILVHFSSSVKHVHFDTITIL